MEMPRSRGLPAMAMPSATVNESATSTTFVVAGRSNIPSGDGTGINEQAHKVAIAQIDLAADLEWVSVPQVQTNAILQCQVKNASQYLLLEGQASVFMDNNFVCKTTIPNVSPQESFSTSLGIDPSVRITYHPLVKHTKNFTSNLGNLLARTQSKADVTSHTQRITVKNTRTTSIGPLIVRDQVPVSNDEAIRVLLHVPKELGLPSDKREVNVTTGVKARFGLDSEGEVTHDGMLEWVCHIGAGKTVELALVWDVVVPPGQAWGRI